MPVEHDQYDLPAPPPPRPARREAAIEAALRKFDGADEAAPAVGERPKRSWGGAHRPQLAVLVSATLLIVVGIPAALIGIRNQPTTSEREPPALVVHDTECVGSHCPRQPAPPAQRAPSSAAEAPEALPSSPRLAAAPPLRKNRGTEAEATTVRGPPTRAAEPGVAPAAPALAAAPPPPPPPPPAAPRAVAERDSEGPVSQNIVVTGTRVPNPVMSSEQGFAAKAAGRAANSDAAGPRYRSFLSRLQAAVGANDRSAVIALIDFPLRVNLAGGIRLYRDERSVEADFDRIFTPRVRRAILKQRPDRLFVRSDEAMIGGGEVWFGQTCPNSACSPVGPVRIVAVNP